MKTWTAAKCNLHNYESRVLNLIAMVAVNGSSSGAASHEVRTIFDAIDADLLERIKAGESAICTCPSGDGSLRWPCPQHPPTQPSTSQAWVQGQVGELRDELGELCDRMKNRIETLSKPSTSRAEVGEDASCVHRWERLYTGTGRWIWECSECFKRGGECEYASKNPEVATEAYNHGYRAASRAAHSAKPEQAAQVPDEMLQQVFRGDEPGRFGYVLGWNDCRRAMIAAAPTPVKESQG